MRIWAFASCSTLVALAACTPNQPTSQDLPKSTSTEDEPSAALDYLNKNKSSQAESAKQIRKAVATPETEALTARPRPQVSNQASASLQERLQRLRAQTNQSSLQGGPSANRQLSPSSLSRVTIPSRVVAPSGLTQSRNSSLPPGISQQGAFQATTPQRLPAPSNVQSTVRPSGTAPIAYAVMPLPTPNAPTPNVPTSSTRAQALGPTTRATTPTTPIPQATSPNPTQTQVLEPTTQTATPTLQVAFLDRLAAGTPDTVQMSTPQADSTSSQRIATAQSAPVQPSREDQVAAVSSPSTAERAVAPSSQLPLIPHQHLATLNQPLLGAATGTPSLHGTMAPQFSPTPSLPVVPIAPTPAQPASRQAEPSPPFGTNPLIQSRLRQLRQSRALPQSLPLDAGQSFSAPQSTLPQTEVCQTPSPEQVSQVLPTAGLPVAVLPTGQGKSQLTAQEATHKSASKAETCAGDTSELAQRMPEAATAGTPMPGRVESPTR